MELDDLKERSGRDRRNVRLLTGGLLGSLGMLVALVAWLVCRPQPPSFEDVVPTLVEVGLDPRDEDSLLAYESVKLDACLLTRNLFWRLRNGEISNVVAREELENLESEARKGDFSRLPENYQFGFYNDDLARFFKEMSVKFNQGIH